METDTTTFLSDEAEDLKCDACNDTSLYHDSWAYFNSDTARVLCEQCHAKEKPENYTKVLTYHLSPRIFAVQSAHSSIRATSGVGSRLKS